MGPRTLQSLFVVHGEESASLAAAEAFADLGVRHVVVPEPGDEVVL
jgi:hypothetical protein